MTINILVTGGYGFIGTNLCNELKKRKFNVFSVDLQNTNRSNYFRCDVANIRQIEHIFDNYGPFDYVFHLAAEYGRWNGEQFYENLWDTNIKGTKNILNLQIKHKFKLIFFSSAEVYGDYSGVMSEDIMIDNPIGDTYQMNDYAISKWAGELMCLNHAKMYDSQIVRVRPINCYGPYEHYTPYRGFIPKFIYLSLTNQEYTVYKNHFRIIDYVEDTCNTFANITDNFISGRAYNVGSKNEWQMDIESYSNLILKITKGNKDLIIYKDAEDHTTKIKNIDFSLAIKELNHDPKIDSELGISKTVSWMKNYYNL